ncbi:hypothetical protein MANY_35850 [Mycolicibacterium anyangense]|uniref:Uncharacterized protein n=1 Tax=Mycolicibacterium anyangense TaxID=1431246 RepID=A0A6N4WCJ6_9MYCO|nr:hypothetical protein [Mycolicibacterium anyangense]BBZ78248.1 hypothetical protein MANY_35850 [Mycolicibacterium anyangense]
MWIALYLVPAIGVAIATWCVSTRFDSFDPPNEVVRAIAAGIAGALWPLVLVGLGQLQAIRFTAHRFRTAGKAPQWSDLPAELHTHP